MNIKPTNIYYLLPTLSTVNKPLSQHVYYNLKLPPSLSLDSIFFSFPVLTQGAQNLSSTKMPYMHCLVSGNLKAVNKYGPMDEGVDGCPENYAEVKL